MNAEATELMERELQLPQTADLAISQAISKAELDQQITTARTYPRSLKTFVNTCREMATLTPAIAKECFYALPARKGGDGKAIIGPSARLAEIVLSAWGNSRAGARVVSEDDQFVTAHGTYHDLQSNVQVAFEVRRRITGRDGRKYSADMIGVTGNAACSIAFRNAVFRGIPKAFWNDIYEAAKLTAAGDLKSLDERRKTAIAEFKKLGVPQDRVLAVLEVKGLEDIGVDELVTLMGIMNAIKDGDTTVDQVFFPDPTTKGKVPDLKKPDGYDDWLANLNAVADEGTAAVEAMFEKAKPEVREYLTRVEGELWNRIKARAAAKK